MTEQSLTLLMIGCAAGGFVIGYLFGGMTYARGDDLIEGEQQSPDISCTPKPPPARDPRGVRPAPPVEPAKPKQKYEKPI